MDENFAIQIAERLHKELFTEILKAAKEERLTGSLMVSKVRDYNRKWNELAETHSDMVVDGFKVYIKQEILKQPFFKARFESSLKYL